MHCIRAAVSPTSSVLKTDQLQCMGQDGNTAHYLIEWLPPDNIMDFDLAYYEVNLMTPNTSIVLLCINSTAIISFNLTIKSVTVSIVAVSQCGQRGAAVETPTLLGTCQSPASSSMSLKLSSMWTMLITACWLFNYYDACFLISVNRWFL